MIKLIKSAFFQEERTRERLAKFVLSNTHLSFGPQCERFERLFQDWQGRDHCLFVNSGSSANLALIQSLLNLGKLTQGDAVGFSSLTWSTNVMPLVQLGLTPVPVDVELDTLNVSPRTLEQAMADQPIKALFLTNLLGLCDDISRIAEMCERLGVLLIEDNCESLGTQYEGTKLGNFGYASTNSFYVGHHLSTVEGGAVCTDDDDLATMVSMVRAHGWDRQLPTEDRDALRMRHKVPSAFYQQYTFYDLGYNLRPTEIQGFIGGTQMEFIDEIVASRARNFGVLAPEVYGDHSAYVPLRYDHIDLVSSFAIPLVCGSVEERDRLITRCDGRVEVRPIVGGSIVEQPFYQKHVSRSRPTPNAALIHRQGLYFANNPELSDLDLEELLDVFTGG